MTVVKTINSELSRIQTTLKAPKGQYNSHGKFSFRNCEDIMEAVKPLLKGLTLTVSDQIELIGERFYVKATATLSDENNSISAQAYAREPDKIKLPCDAPQVTGSCSSYARKFALNGLFCIDDNKDSDSATAQNNKEYSKPSPSKPTPTKTARDKDLEALKSRASSIINSGTNKKMVLKRLGVDSSKELSGFSDKEILEAFTMLKNEFM